MQKQPCPFGPAFREARHQRELSQWTVAVRMGYHTRNIQRIEQGEQQPGIMLALRLVVAVEANVGEFFERLYAATVKDAGQEEKLSCVGTFEIPLPESVPEVKCLFGPLFRQARLHGQVSQTALAKFTGYNLRNLNAVEKGQQEPGVMAALKMVGATGVDMRSFFEAMHSLIRRLCR